MNSIARLASATIIDPPPELSSPSPPTDRRTTGASNVMICVGRSIVEKAMTKLSRYSPSGNTHRSGIATISVVRCVVVDSIRPGGKQHEQRITRGPAPALGGQRHGRFDERGIAEQPRKAAKVRRSVKIIGVARARVGGKPALHQRRLRRDDEKDGTDRGEQEQGHPQRLLPRSGGCDRLE